MNPAAQYRPQLPRPFSLPLGLIPGRVHSRALAVALNRLFDAPLREGELDFLAGCRLRIHISDLRLTLDLTLRDGRLAGAETAMPPDLSITGSVHAFLLLATRQEDTDTLFFQRRLRTEGDTELGLALKNFLDALEPERYWLTRRLEHGLQRALPVYEHLFSRSGAD
jgi:predicted lipid carrier protein YhbT